MPAPLSESEPIRDQQTDFSLLTPEEVAFKRRLRRAAVYLAGTVVILILGWYTGRPAVHAIKGWQARRAAAQAMEAIDRADWKMARTKVQDAYALRPSDPEVIRTAAVFLTRVGSGREAVSHWKVLESMRPLTVDEQRDFATAALVNSDFATAVERLARAWPAGKPGTPADWWLGMQLALRSRQIDEILRLARLLIDDPGSSEKQRLGAAEILLSLGQPEAADLGWKTIEKIARGGRSAESLSALLLLTRRTAAAIAVESAATASSAAAPDIPATASPTPPPAGETRPLPSNEVISLIEHHPLAKAPLKLLTYDLRLLAKPSDRAGLIDEAIKRFADSKDLDDLAALASWLYGKGEFVKVMEVLPLKKALLSRALFLQYLDTLGATRHWLEIKDLIQAQRFPLDPILQQMYLARCTEQLGQPDASRVHWSAAIEMAKGNAEKLASLGQYAQKVGSLDFAELAFRSAYTVAPQSRPVCEELLRVLERRGETAKMVELLQTATTVWPADTAMRNDLLYLSVLLGDANPANTSQARELVRADPASLPHRVTLALAEYRQGHAMSALDAFAGINLSAANIPPRFLAVYSVILWATDYVKEARAVVARINQDQLLPEEKELIQPVIKG